MIAPPPIKRFFHIVLCTHSFSSLIPETLPLLSILHFLRRIRPTSGHKARKRLAAGRLANRLISQIQTAPKTTVITHIWKRGVHELAMKHHDASSRHWHRHDSLVLNESSWNLEHAVVPSGTVRSKRAVMATWNYNEASIFDRCIYQGNPDGENVGIIRILGENGIILVPGRFPHQD